MKIVIGKLDLRQNVRKKDLLSFATNLIKKVPDPDKTKEIISVTESKKR